MRSLALLLAALLTPKRHVAWWRLNLVLSWSCRSAPWLMVAVPMSGVTPVLIVKVEALTTALDRCRSLV